MAGEHLLFDADNHYYEAEDAFTRYAPTEQRHRIRWLTTSDGKRRLAVGDRIYRFIANPTFDPIARPGVLTEMFEDMHAGRTIAGAGEAYGELEPIRGEYRDRDMRLACMENQGVDSIILLPTLGLTVEHLMKDDAAMTAANLTAFNRWLEDDWGFAYANRIFAVPMLSLLDVELAVAELERVIERGARAVHLRPGPVAGRSPADPIFDPFWARVNEAQVAVLFHASEAGYNEMFSTAWGEPANPPSHLMSPFQWVTAFGDRPVLDTMAALILHNLFGRFPNVRVASIEMGAAWAPYLLHWLDKAVGLGRRVANPGKPLPAKPSELFREHVYVSPYPEEDLTEVASLLGVERVLLGSDWPHAEGLAQPRDYLQKLGAFSPADIEKITRVNARRLIAID